MNNAVKYVTGGSSPDTVVFRSASSDDLPFIRGMIREERLNPLGLDWKRFMVGEDEVGDIVACGQVKGLRTREQDHRTAAVFLGSTAVVDL